MMKGEPGHVLVVDDDEGNLRLLQRQLERLGHTVAVVQTGREAFNVLHTQSFDLLLLDIMMPGMDGYQVLEQVKDDPALSHIPVIVVSAIDDLDSIIRCIELGAEDYIFKPIKTLLLQARINACLEKKRLRDREQAYYSAVQAANIAKSEFVSVVSHELKTPMTVIQGYTDVLTAGSVGPVNEAQASCLGAIRSSVDYMVALVADLSDISRIEAGHLRLEQKSIVLNEVIERVIETISSQIEKKAQILTLDVPADLPYVWGDRTRLIQALTNLVSNAYKYTPIGGTIQITADLLIKDDQQTGMQQMVHISVRDTGIGITPEDQAQIFQKFFRSEDYEAQKVQGTGLGLSITKYLIEMQGGRIWLESEFRRGTTIHFTIPVADTTS